MEKSRDSIYVIILICLLTYEYLQTYSKKNYLQPYYIIIAQDICDVRNYIEINRIYIMLINLWSVLKIMNI